MPKCVKIKVEGKWKDNCLQMIPFGVADAVNRFLNPNGTLTWVYGGTIWLLHKIPKPPIDGFAV